MSTELIVAKQHFGDLSEAEKGIARRVIFGMVDGLNEQHKARWRRFWAWAFKAEPGEMVTFVTNRQRSGPFHRRHFLIEQRLFDAQERFDDFDVMRTWLLIGAGFVTWAAGPRGGVVPIPKSMKYSRLDEDGMCELHVDVIAFLRGPHAAPALWPHLRKRPEEAAAMMERVLAEFDE